MENLEIPFHKFLNIKRYTDSSEFILMIDERPEYLNHVGTVHACAQITLAEATSGEFLTDNIPNLIDKFFPVVRKSQTKYHKPAHGSLFSKAKILETTIPQIVQEVEEKGRAVFQIEVKVFDSTNVNTLTAVFDWFIGKR
jgi:hypothetical protein